MRGRQFYEPEVQPQQATPMRGFQVTIGGTYVLLDDIVTVLREYAQSMDDHAWDAVGYPNPREVVHEVATWLQSGERPDLPTSVGDTIQVEIGSTFHEVDRIEVYPDDPTAPEPRWVARACSPDGDILDINRGSFDQGETIDDAKRKWGDLPVHVVTEAGVDTVWEERDPGGIRSSSSGRRRPSPKRLFA